MTCPICGASGGEPAGQLAASRLPILASYYRCPDCGGEWQAPLLYDFEAMYGTGEYRRIIGMTLAECLREQDARAEAIFPDIASRATNVHRALDFGSGLGRLLRLLEDMMGCDVVGVELDEEHADFAQDSGIRTVATLDDTSGHFELVTAVHSLEHLPQPARTMRELALRLTSGGRLFAEVPAGSRMDFHTAVFQELSLQRCAEQAGLEVLECGGDGFLRLWAQKPPL